MSRITRYLPHPKKQVLVQVKVDAELCEQVRLVMREKRYTWTQIIEACLKGFLQELKEKEDL